MSPARPARPVRGGRARRLGLAVLLLPFVEIAVAVVVAHWIGAGWTLLALLVSSALGLWLVRREGLGTVRRWRGRRPGSVAAGEVGEVGLRFVAAALLLVPGLLTGVCGLLLLLPPVRRGVAAALARGVRRRLAGTVRGRTVRGELLDADGVRVTSWVGEGDPPQLSPPSSPQERR